MNDPPQPIPPAARLQTLLAIPERQRTDAEWDEINELEIKLASGNRAEFHNRTFAGTPLRLAVIPDRAGATTGQETGENSTTGLPSRGNPDAWRGLARAGT